MDAAKSHILLSSTRSRQFKWLPFEGGKIQTTTKAKYLGVQIIARGIIPGHVKKYQAAHQTITQLSRARIIVTGMTPWLPHSCRINPIESGLCIHSDTRRWCRAVKTRAN